MEARDVMMVGALPLLLVWLLAARLISMVIPLLIIPSLITAKTFYWCMPMAKALFSHQDSAVKGFLMRIGFEGTYCMSVWRRWLTLPLRRSLPDFYILGFPKCGTTAMASYLMQHPAVRGLDGLQWDTSLKKESHFFSGVLGRRSTGCKRLYQSLFPTCVERWWCERVQGFERMLCMDACPLNACLPYVADRLRKWTPDAKLIVMVRDPVDALFSGETMLRNSGLPLSWTIAEETDELKHPDVWKEAPAAEAYWNALKSLKEDDVLPEDLPEKMYTDFGTMVHFSKFAERIQPFLDAFPRENIMFVDMKKLKDDSIEATIDSVLEFVGADTTKYNLTKVKMWSGDRKGRAVDPTMRTTLTRFFASYNEDMYKLVGENLGWGKIAMNAETA